MTSRRFTFTLESIRTVREHTQQVAMRQLAHELDRAAELEAELDTAEAMLTAACAARLEGGTASDLSARQVYLERRERELGDARVRAQVQAGHVEKGRDQLTSATVDRETLDRLADRQRAVHLGLERRADRIRSEEISLAMRREHLGGAA
jgi:flagellar export protein FliJ